MKRDPWKRTFSVKDVFHNDDLTIYQKADIIRARIQRARWYDDDDYDLVGIVEEMTDIAESAGHGDSEAEAVEWFDDVWSAFYDYADAERIWVVTL